MKNPFEYGGVVGADAFCNRRKELADLARAMENAEKLFVLSERRLGKTSLVRAALNRLPRKGYVHVQGLLGKDIIDREGESYLITDRFLRLWIQSAQSP